MAESRRPSSTSSSLRVPSIPLRPAITLPPRTSVEGLFTGESPSPMTLVSNFFSDVNDPCFEGHSFSQILAGSTGSPAVRPSFPPHTMSGNDASFKPRESGSSAGGGGEAEGDVDFLLKGYRPAGLVITQPAIVTIPPGFSPATLLDSPGFFSSCQDPCAESHQQVLAQVTAQEVQAQSHVQTDFPSSSSAPNASLLQACTSFTTAPHHMFPAIPDHNMAKQSSEISNFDRAPQPSSFALDKPADDGYNWRKYGQKQVKGSEYPRSYYKCTHADCPVKKQIERSFYGHVTEIIYKGKHNHQPPQSNKRTRETGSMNGTLGLQGSNALGSEVQTGSLNMLKERVSNFLSVKDQEFGQAEPDCMSGSSNSEEVNNAETRVDERDGNEEPESKRRNIEVKVSDPASSHRALTEPKIVFQTTSKVDLLDDGYRWRKYGQKVVKGNSHPRNYYKCTNPGCNIRKHIERSASDPKAVITTYEGKHNHDVPAPRNGNHSTTNNSALLLRPHNAGVEHAFIERTEYGNYGQPAALLQFKEQIA